MLRHSSRVSSIISSAVYQLIGLSARHCVFAINHYKFEMRRSLMYNIYQILKNMKIYVNSNIFLNKFNRE